MYFWKIKELKNDFKQSRVSESDRFKYFFILNFLLSLTVVLGDSRQGYWFNVDKITFFLISVFGLIYAYKVNGGSNGKDFVGKFVCLGWVFSVRYLILFFIPIMLVGQFIFDFAANTIEMTLEEVVFNNLILVIWFYGFSRHLAELQKGAG